MYRAAFAALMGASLLAVPASAFELTAGSVGLEKSQLTDSGNRSFDKGSLKGQVEMQVAPQFSVQGDLSIADLGATDDTGTSLGLHAIYQHSDTTSFGGYVGFDNARFNGLGHNAEDAAFYGVEVANQMGQLKTEVYVGGINDSVMDGTQMGLNGRYELNETTGIGARFDTLNLDGPNASRLGVTGDLRLGQTGTLYGEVGRAKIAAVGNENYVSIGAKVNFGSKPSTTFGQRGILDMIPGL